MANKPAFITGTSPAPLVPRWRSSTCVRSWSPWRAPVGGEAYITFKPGLIDKQGDISDEGTRRSCSALSISFRCLLHASRSAPQRRRRGFGRGGSRPDASPSSIADLLGAQENCNGPLDPRIKEVFDLDPAAVIRRARLVDISAELRSQRGERDAVIVPQNVEVILAVAGNDEALSFERRRSAPGDATVHRRFCVTPAGVDNQLPLPFLFQERSTFFCDGAIQETRR